MRVRGSAAMRSGVPSKSAGARKSLPVKFTP
jgi:hypothetical protein